VAVDPDTKEVIAKGGEKPGAAQIVQGKNPETGKEEHFVVDKKTGNYKPVNLEVAPNVSTVRTIDGNVLAGDKTTARKIFFDTLGMDDTIQRVDKILDDFDPEYFTYYRQGSEAGKKLLRKGGLKLPEDADKRSLEYRFFQGDLQSFVNSYIKQITGAQMGEKEAERIMKALGSFEDDAIGFEAKMTAMRDAMYRSRDLYAQRMAQIQASDMSEDDKIRARKSAEFATENAFADTVSKAAIEYEVTGKYSGAEEPEQAGQPGSGTYG